MSEYLDERESLILSTRLNGKREVKDYRFSWIKKLVDKLFPPKLPNWGATSTLGRPEQKLNRA